MNYNEAMDALKKGVPVKYKDLEYKHINAVILRKRYDTRNNFVDNVIQAEMQSNVANSVTIANIKEIGLVMDKIDD